MKKKSVILKIPIRAMFKYSESPKELAKLASNYKFSTV